MTEIKNKIIVRSLSIFYIATKEKAKKRMTKKILSTTILFLFIILFSSNGIAKTIKIGCIEDYYPYITVNKSGDLEGIIIDWWNLWSIKTGVDIEFVPLDLQSCIEQTESGEIDAIAGLLYSTERAERIDFSEPLMRMLTVVFLKNGIKTDSIKNLDVVINSVENSVAHLYLKNTFPVVELNTFKTYASLINAIYLQNIDGFTYNIPNPIGNYKQPVPPTGYYLYETLFTERLRPAVKKGNSELLSLLTAGVAKITDEELF